MQKFANPMRFMALSGAVLPWLWAAAGVLLAVGMSQSIFLAPADYQQGETVRIMTGVCRPLRRIARRTS